MAYLGTKHWSSDANYVVDSYSTTSLVKRIRGG
jgi:hypothetical protein